MYRTHVCIYCNIASRDKRGTCYYLSRQAEYLIKIYMYFAEVTHSFCGCTNRQVAGVYVIPLIRVGYDERDSPYTSRRLRLFGLYRVLACIIDNEIKTKNRVTGSCLRKQRTIGRSAS